MTRGRVLVVVTLAVAVVACGGGGPSRSDAMAAVAADAAVPALQAFAADARAMAEAVDEACVAPSAATVDSALTAVDAARERWLVSHSVWTGPVMERRAAGAVDWPVDAGAVEVLVTGAAPGELTAEVITEEVGSDTRGLRALRGVLARDDAVALLADERWCDYVTAVAAVVADAGDVMVGDWTESFDGGDADAGRSRTMEVDRTLTTEVAAKLGVVIGFSDADGDGSG